MPIPSPAPVARRLPFESAVACATNSTSCYCWMLAAAAPPPDPTSAKTAIAAAPRPALALADTLKSATTPTPPERQTRPSTEKATDAEQVACKPAAPFPTNMPPRAVPPPYGRLAHQRLFLRHHGVEIIEPVLIEHTAHDWCERHSLLTRNNLGQRCETRRI